MLVPCQVPAKRCGPTSFLTQQSARQQLAQKQVDLTQTNKLLFLIFRESFTVRLFTIFTVLSTFREHFLEQVKQFMFLNFSGKVGLFNFERERHPGDS